MVAVVFLATLGTIRSVRQLTRVLQHHHTQDLRELAGHVRVPVLGRRRYLELAMTAIVVR